MFFYKFNSHYTGFLLSPPLLKNARINPTGRTGIGGSRDGSGIGGSRDDPGIGGSRDDPGIGGSRDDSGIGGSRDDSGTGGSRGNSGTGGSRDNSGGRTCSCTASRITIRKLWFKRKCEPMFSCIERLNPF